MRTFLAVWICGWVATVVLNLYAMWAPLVDAFREVWRERLAGTRSNGYLFGFVAACIGGLVMAFVGWPLILLAVAARASLPTKENDE